ncbi:Protease 4 [Symmachiella macrocystis]|uniref:Protease 4 n=1 Tax=Symmachiella macrocystis TaxID=2527985 RepID=A0A5C6BMA8_9PLAN|nr:signal peptide peptidase SppA [Symmachiella macrocystis]TWU11624.1 Protease 4 [Symmachiella macrocystis]
MRRMPATIALVVSALFCTYVAAADEKKSAEATATKSVEKPAKKPEKKPVITWAHLDITGSYPEGAQAPPLFSKKSDSLATIIERLDKAADDRKVTGVILNISGPTIGRAKLNELRQAIGNIRAKGKPVYAWVDQGSSGEYQIATACDQIYMPESATLMLTGLRAEISFYKNLFDKAGIQPEMLRVGAFKSAAEPYTRTEMSPEFRQEMNEIIGNFYEQMISMIAEARKLDPKAVEAAIDTAPLSAAEAHQLGLIDHVAYEDQLIDAVEQLNPEADVKLSKRYGKKKMNLDFSLFGFQQTMNQLMGIDTKRSSKRPKIAVIYATGAITSGRSGSSMFGGQSLGSETLIKAIREVREDETVKAVVLRVDSPGGSALASDLMWRELELLEVPFYVSMGDTAASGGYYIAMGADRIFAEPGTLTGSIGVVGGKLAIGGLFNKVGVTTSVISRGKNAGVFSTTDGFTESERAAMVKLLNTVYEQFTGKAAKGRGMDLARLKELAGGRVYTGTQALKVGLVDELGTLADTITAVKVKAGFDADKNLELKVLPKAPNPLEAFLGPMDADARSSAAQTALLRRTLDGIAPELTRQLQGLELLRMFGNQRVLVLMPFNLHLN